MRRTLYLAGALAVSAGVLQAQQAPRAESRDRDPADRRMGVFSYSQRGDPDRAMIGISTSSGGKRDTLGLLVASVTPGGPAEKAGIEEGNRLVSINGVNLRLSPADAGESDMEGIANRRLVREMEKVKAGDEVTLRVWASGQSRDVRVKTVAAEDLPDRVSRITRRDLEDRPTLGMSLTATGSRRDTLGMMVVRVTTDGPVEKAGIIEGDRIAAINGVNLRVAAEDAGDSYMSSARISRYRRELSRINVGEDVELRVWSGGQEKTVRVKPVRVGDLPRDRSGVFIIGDGAIGFGATVMPAIPAVPAVPPVRVSPRVFDFEGDFGRGFHMHVDPHLQYEIRERAEDAARRARDAARELIERFDGLRFDGRRFDDRRVDVDVDVDDAERERARRARAGARIASASASTSDGEGGGWTSTAPAVVSAAASAPAQSVWVSPAVATTSHRGARGGSVAVWNGDGSTFTLNGIRLARVNPDLADYLGEGSERGFLVLETADRWQGIRAGDVLLAVDATNVRDGNAARIALTAGDDHSADVIRDGRRIRVDLEVH